MKYYIHEISTECSKKKKKKKTLRKVPERETGEIRGDESEEVIERNFPDQRTKHCPVSAEHRGSSSVQTATPAPGT